MTYWKLKHGIRWTGMPAFDRAFSDKQLWQLTLFFEDDGCLPPAAQRAWQEVKA